MYRPAVLSLLLAALASACSAGAPTHEPTVAPTAQPHQRAAIVREVVFTGTCDASGAVPLSATAFVVADDEDNVLRVYDADRGGAPLALHDVSSSLRVPMRGKKAPRPAEADLEGGTRLGERAFWITSHGRTSSGKESPERMRFFASNVPAPGEDLHVIGTCYERLLDDLVADPQLASFGLDQARQLSPKAPGGLNVEGITAWEDGALLIGLRSPVPEQRALIVPLYDANQLVDGTAARARFGPPMRLDLGGHGVRALSSWRGRLLVAAGNPGDGGRSRLYTWRAGRLEEVALDLRVYNPEGFFTPEERDQILVLSDDGTQLVDGVPCKRVEDAARKSFRGIWIDLAP